MIGKKILAYQLALTALILPLLFMGCGKNKDISDTSGTDESTKIQEDTEVSEDAADEPDEKTDSKISEENQDIAEQSEDFAVSDSEEIIDASSETDFGEEISVSDVSGMETVGNINNDTPFYGVWTTASKDLEAVSEAKDKLKGEGFDAQILYAPEWENLNSEPYYCLTAGACETEEEAEKLLADAKAAGYKDAYVKPTGKRLCHMAFYTIYSESVLEVGSDQVILRDVQVNDIAEDEGGKMTLIVDGQTVFDDACELEFFGNYREGDTPLQWIQYNYGLYQEDYDQYSEEGPALVGVFEVSLTGNHVDKYFGSYWWD
ncbi:MAG: SPOR domain-containing protein [Lachnospiraceae bacterium]|nr:SPOR domain-containing protein [Lachnospiraceae bacterium]